MTASTTNEPFRVFDPDSDTTIVERRLPHWGQAGTLCFLTWRTWDSMPAGVLASWVTDRTTWLARHGIDAAADWRSAVARLPRPERNEFHQQFSAKWHALLDACHGACVLRRPELWGLVADSIRHFDGERYVVTDFVVMPNHVHVLAAFDSEERMLAQCESWKHYTAVRLNRALGRSGRFWQVDGFDHLVRSEEQFAYLRGYIAGNPGRAGLHEGGFCHYSLDWDSRSDSQTP